MHVRTLHACAHTAHILQQGWMREGFKATFNRLRVLWYDRHGKDDTIRQRVAATLASGCSVLVFAEGTTQRCGGQSIPSVMSRQQSLRCA
jgi:1-acyl-sn-glycerol-3-phosphate acyltransferase